MNDVQSCIVIYLFQLRVYVGPYIVKITLGEIPIPKKKISIDQFFTAFQQEAYLMVMSDCEKKKNGR